MGAADYGARPSSLRFRVLLHARDGQVGAQQAPLTRMPVKSTRLAFSSSRPWVVVASLVL